MTPYWGHVFTFVVGLILGVILGVLFFADDADAAGALIGPFWG